MLRPDEMALADRAAIEAGTPAEVLMERAGRAVARAAIEVAGGRYGRRAVVVCGKGNNGGDGFVAARRLLQEGLGVRCLCVFDPAEASGAPRHHLELMLKAGIAPEGFDPRFLEDADVIVDAIFGTGFKGAAEGAPGEAISAIDGYPGVVSIDIPSGVNAATGGVEGPAIHAEITVAVAAEKVGTALPPGASHAGYVRVVDIGVDPNLRNLEEARNPDGTPVAGFKADSYVEMVMIGDVRASLAPRPADAHKGSVGSVAIVTGSHEIRGAPLLTSLGAVRAGAGYVSLGTTSAVKQAAATLVPEVLCTEVTDGEVLGPKALDLFADAIGRADCLAIGPGLGTGEEQRALVLRALDQVEIPIVLDADGLNVLATDPSPLEQRRAATVLTPHPAELARLLGTDTDRVVGDRLAAALEASHRFGRAVVVAKGWRTIVAYSEGRAALIVPVGGPELATAGTGDVLTGAIAARIAAGTPPVGAAISGVWIHGIAGAVAADRMGGEGIGAGDVARALPEAIELIRAAAE